MVQAPIWKDTYYTYYDASALTYYIKADSATGETIFNGKAYFLPDEDVVKINVSKICADYLDNDLPSLAESSYTNTNASRQFYLYSGDDSFLEVFLFNYDWSYETNPVGLSPRYAMGQKVVSTSKEDTGYTTTISTYSDSSLYCGRFALIYLQPDGRWNSFLMEGLYKIEDDFNSYTTDRTYNNTTIEFNKNKYVNEITTTYELNSGWLSDAESELFAKNIFRSIKVYLQDMEKNRIIPVVITETNVERKKYINEKKLITYKIRVEESQNKEIR